MVSQILSTKELSKKAWLVCLTASLSLFYVLFQMSSFNTLSTILIDHFKINSTQLGNLAASYFYAQALFALPAGLLLDHFSTRRILILTIIISSISTLGLAKCDSLFFFTFCRSIHGIANAFAILGCMRLSAIWFAPQRLALVMGLILTIGMLGCVIAQVPFAILLIKLSWRDALWIDAGVGFLFTMIMWLVIIDNPQYIYSTNNQIKLKNFQRISLLKKLKTISADPINWCSSLYTALINIPVVLLGALWGNLYLIHAQGVTAKQASLITSMIFIGLILGSPIIGWLSDRLQLRRGIMLIAALVLLLISYTIIYLINGSIAQLLLTFFLLGFLSGAQIISYAILAIQNPSILISAATSILSILTNVVGALVQPIYGWLVANPASLKLVNFNNVFSSSIGYKLALNIMPIAFFICFVLILIMHEKKN